MSGGERLTTAEQDALAEACEGAGEYLCCHRTVMKRDRTVLRTGEVIRKGTPVGGEMFDAVERIVAQRVAAAEEERNASMGARAARDQRRYEALAVTLHKAVLRAEVVEQIARFAEESEAGWRREADEQARRAEAAERRLTEQQAALTALADEWEQSIESRREYVTLAFQCAADELRATLADTEDGNS